LLAWSLKDEALPHLENAFRCEKKSNVKEDICAAMDAIKHKNSNYFVDRDHTGLTELKVK